MSSNRPSEPSRPGLLGELARDVPTTEEDVRALRATREPGVPAFPDLSALPGVAAALARRPTGEGREELRL